MSTLFIVATPIGNLGDISERALDTFRNVDVIAAEDTRHTLRLLNRFGIKKHLISCRARNEDEGARQVISVLDKGQNVAYASDAGTPALSDPGAVLVRMARDSGHIISPIPGPSAFAALLSDAGGYDKSVVFEGFLPQRPGKRRTRIAELMGSGSGVVFYESPYRIVKLLGDVADIGGPGLPGSKELTENTVRALGSNPGCIMANHGMLACGKDLEQALERCLAMEEAAKRAVGE